MARNATARSHLVEGSARFKQGSNESFPGAGAMFAEVIVDEVTHKVTIRTYWS